jgi:hypothetical protein
MNRALLVLLFAGCASETTTEYTGEPRRFVVDALDVPTNNTQARAFGLTINDDRSVDNQLGMVIGALAGFGDVTTHGPDMIAAGVIASSVELVADDLDNDPTVALRYFGADGAETTPIRGEIGELGTGMFHTTDHGLATAHLPIFVDADPSVVTLQYARMMLVPDAAGGYTAYVGGAVEHTEANVEAFRGAAQMMAAHPMEHLQMFRMLDESPRDFMVTQHEWDTNSLIASLMSPDLQFGDDKFLSIGFRVHLTPCAEGRCSGASPAETCFDRLLDGDETDVDCGGSCAACSAARTCSEASDCESRACSGGTCAGPSCFDGVRDGLETDVDCGASCGGCKTGQGCWSNADCLSGQCGAPCSGLFCDDYALDTCQ